MNREQVIEVLTADGCTKAEAEKALKRGTTVFEDFEEHFENYMKEWGVDEEEVERFREMIKTKEPVEDWGVVEKSGKTSYIQYVL